MAADGVVSTAGCFREGSGAQRQAKAVVVVGAMAGYNLGIDGDDEGQDDERRRGGRTGGEQQDDATGIALHRPGWLYSAMAQGSVLSVASVCCGARPLEPRTQGKAARLLSSPFQPTFFDRISGCRFLSFWMSRKHHNAVCIFASSFWCLTQQDALRSNTVT